MFHIGDVVRKLRLAQGLTIPQLAEEAAVNPKTISGIERGERTSQRETLGRLAQALGLGESVTIFDEKLMEWCAHQVGPARVRAEYREVLALWQKLDASPEAQRMMLLLLRREVRLLDPAVENGRLPVSTVTETRGRARRGDAGPRGMPNPTPAGPPYQVRQSESNMVSSDPLADGGAGASRTITPDALSGTPASESRVAGNKQ
jgi:transcriptional regulator with XRE-family HTH domain